MAFFSLVALFSSAHAVDRDSLSFTNYFTLLAIQESSACYESLLMLGVVIFFFFFAQLFENCTYLKCKIISVNMCNTCEIITQVKIMTVFLTSQNALCPVLL